MFFATVFVVQNDDCQIHGRLTDNNSHCLNAVKFGRDVNLNIQILAIKISFIAEISLMTNQNIISRQIENVKGKMFSAKNILRLS